MADLALSDYLTLMRSELHLLGVDEAFRDGHSTDPENASNPSSISLTAKLNEARAEIQIEVGYKKSEATFATVSGTRAYSLPSGIQTVESLRISNKRLRSTTVKEKDAISHDWWADSGTPKQFFMRGAKNVGLYPNPNAVLTVTVYGLASLTSLSVTTDSDSDMPEPFQYLFAIRACLNIAGADSGSEMNQDRMKYLQGRHDSIFKSLVEYIGEVTQDENAAKVVSGRSQTSETGASQ